jgi:alpha-mannosidase
MYSASMAELSASMRRATERLRGAEAMATLVSMKQPDFYSNRRDARRDAWEGMGLYWEHDWTADSKILERDARRDWQRRTALKVTSYVDSLTADATQALGAQIETHGSRPRYFVFNPLNWRRSDAADLPYRGPEKIHVIDISNGKTVPSQFADIGDEHGSVKHVLRIWATDIPSVGYKTFEVLPEVADAAPSELKTWGDTLENDTYRVRLDGSGAVDSIVAKKFDNREMVSRINGRSLNDWGTGFEVNELHSGKIESINVGPVSATLRVTITSPLPRTVEVTLYREGDRIDIRNEVHANFRDLETWAFSLNLTSPDVHHEEVGAINHARLAPEGDYAGTYSRLDWLTLNHFASMSSSDGTGVTLSNWDAAFMKLGQSEMIGGVSQFDTATPQITVLAGGQVDGPSLGIAAQGGDKYLLQRFALQVYKTYRPATSMRFALEHQNPLLAGVITGGHGFPEKQFSLLSTSAPDLLLWALKPSEEGSGKGVAARFWNMSEAPKEFTVSMDGGLDQAWNLTHLETETGRASVVGSSLHAKAAQWQILTFRLLPSPAGGGGRK